MPSPTVFPSSFLRAPVGVRLVRFISRHRLDLLFGAGLVLLALLIRWPNLFLIPRMTDEMTDILWVGDLVRGRDILRLRSLDLYRGPILEYIVLILFRLGGIQPLLPRVVVMVFGSLTVGMTYLAGRLMKGRVAGLVAAGFMLALPSHILINSHVSWGNSLTPFFVVPGLALVYYGVDRLRGPFLVFGGLLLGIAVQTHPFAAFVVPPLLIWFVFRRDLQAWLRSPWPWLAVGAAALGYWNMLLYNLLNNWASLNQTGERGYAFHLATSVPDYLVQLNGSLAQYLAMISANIGSDGNVLGYLVRLPDLLIAWPVLIGLIYAVWRRESFLLIITAGYLALLAFVNYDYTFFQTRYLASLPPLGFIALGVLVQDVGQALARRRRSTGRDVLAVRAGIPAAALLLLLLISVGLFRLNRFYAEETAQGRTNEPFFAMASVVEARPDHSVPVFVDPDDPVKWPLGGSAGSAVEFMLRIADDPPRWVDVGGMARRLPLLEKPEAYLLVTPRSFTELKFRLPGYRFEELLVSPPQRDEPPNRLGLYHFLGKSAEK